MCGIVGMLCLDGGRADSRVLEQMSAIISHRGPDASGAYVSGPLGLASRRLAILDRSDGGNQPMLSPDGQVVLVFNGEIYNYIELRAELQAHGHIFMSSGDTEVLLHAYLRWGRDCLPRLNGMWAFLIYDARRKLIFGARDRFGKKPLYYCRGTQAIFFGSEIKSILASGCQTHGPNWGKLSSFLLGNGLENMEEDGHTFYSGIDQLPAGQAFEMDMEGRINRWSFWSLPDALERAEMTRNADPAESFYEVFESACSLRMRSDVPVGILLSGGVDSTSILCCLARMTGNLHGSLTAFSYQTKEYDESSYISDSIKQTGVKLVHCQLNSRGLWKSLEKMLWHQDEPVHSLAAVVAFEVYRTAALHGTKVVLNGGGPDEFLAGYPSFFPNYWCTLLRNGHPLEAWREMSEYCAVRGGRPWSLFRGALRLSYKSELRRFGAYRELARWKRLRTLARNRWFTKDLIARVPASREEYLEPTLDAALERSVAGAPLPVYLRVDDRNSMAHSVEARLPFLDHRLVSLTFRLPARWKMRGPWNKYLLRHAMRNRIPESVRSRVEKWGFPVPARQWFASDLSEPIRDLLESQRVRERGIYNLDTIRREYELHRKGEIDVSGRLFDIVQFELWTENGKRLSYAA
jgi:asparagine synthase (glutamine-hydrolysing)